MVALFAAANANAITKFGVFGGATFPSVKTIQKGAQTGVILGAACQLDLPLGFAIQPSLMYNSVKFDSIEVPVSFQWGPDLLIFRPFLEVAPYVGYKLSDIKGLGYGIGLGGGLEVWRFQATCRYNWNLEDVLVKHKGVTVSLAYFF